MRKEHKVSEKSMKNLEKGIPTRFNSETGKLYAKKGQEASVIARKRNKNMATLAVAVGNTKVTDEELLKDLDGLGLTEEEKNYNALVVAGVQKEARKGVITAVEKWEEWMERGEEDLTAELEQIASVEDRALALARANYLENINSGFGPISAYALKHRYTHYEASGGRGSGKSSWASLTVVRLVMEHPDVHALVLRKVANTLRDSVYAQYLWAIEQLGVSEFWEAKKSPMELAYLPTGQKILFRGADDPAKIKSIKTEFGYIGITHFEEKDQFSGRAEIDSILQSTMRGGREIGRAHV